ncbi:MAG: polysaccharide lyase family 8 super-sandwich domain-containing protein [Planctomycetota bacterium]
MPSLGLLVVGLILVAAFWAAPIAAAADRAGVAAAMSTLREGYALRPFRAHQLRTDGTADAATSISLLESDGAFSDLRDQEAALRDDGSHQSPYGKPQFPVAEVSVTAWNRIWRIAEEFRGKPDNHRPELRGRLLRAIARYAAWETSRPDGRFRFHESCFAVPTAATNTYFCLLSSMEAVEAGETVDHEVAAAHRWLMATSSQAWLLPGRGDETDANPVQVDRFRHHVWWVGGNGLTYRPVFQVAVMLNRPDKIDVLAEVAHGALSPTTFNTWDTAFWEEGITADGLGWGHGRQTLVFGYPFDGTLAVLGIVDRLRGTPWERPISEASLDTLMSLLRGSSWAWYRDYCPPMFDRANMQYETVAKPNRHKGFLLADRLLKDFDDSLNDAQRRELRWYVDAASVGGQFTDDPPAPAEYTGVRYFWNNDLLAVKNDRWHLLVNMSSARADGLESAPPMAGFNFFTTDGQAMFQRAGNAHGRALGASELTLLPGITAREEVRPLQSIVNWSGYPSLHNLAGGVALGEFGCAGFHFEKTNRHLGSPDYVNEKNPWIYGVFAAKSYFVFGDTVVALGAGIRDLMPEHGGHIRTSVEQALWSGDVAIHDPQQSDGPITIAYEATPEPFSLSRSMASSASAGLQVRHDGFTYTVLPDQTDGTAELRLERRNTRWNELSQTNKRVETPLAENILGLYIDHGPNPRNARYGYVVRTSESGEGSGVASMPRVIANTPDVQAVASADGGVVQAVFFAPGRVEGAGWEVSASAPAVLMVEATPSGWRVTASDPQQLVDPAPLRVQLVDRMGGAPRRGQAELRFPEVPRSGSQVVADVVAE